MLSHYVDWQPIIDDIDNSDELTILELGCGSGTSFLTDRFKFVYSYELNTRDPEGYWFNITKTQLETKNWLGFFDTDFYKHTVHVDISKLINNIESNIDLNSINVLFVDPGFNNRAECVLEFAAMNKFQYIFTHDTNTHPEQYGWELLQSMPSTYELHSRINTGQGTTLWKQI